MQSQVLTAVMSPFPHAFIQKLDLEHSRLRNAGVDVEMLLLHRYQYRHYL